MANRDLTPLLMQPEERTEPAQPETLQWTEPQETAPDETAQLPHRSMISHSAAE